MAKVVKSRSAKKSNVVAKKATKAVAHRAKPVSKKLKAEPVVAAAKKGQNKAIKTTLKATLKTVVASAKSGGIKGKNTAEGPVAKAMAAPIPATGKKKEISQRLLETIEKRKLERSIEAGKKPNPFGRPPARRGRRPKNVDYNPENREEEESYVLESDNEAFEYDTGIRVKEGKEDTGFVFERADEFDEELNFDW